MKARNSHIFERHPCDRYVEPEWCTRALFAVERFAGLIWDPACGTGNVLKAARDADLSSYGSDISQDAIGTTQDFLAASAPVRDYSIVTNPPFALLREFAERALKLGALKVAMVCPVPRLNAAHWTELLPLARIWLLTPRPSMPPADALLRGEKAKGGREDYCWLIFEPGYEEPPTTRWLHRERKVSQMTELHREPASDPHDRSPEKS